MRVEFHRRGGTNKVHLRFFNFRAKKPSKNKLSTKPFQSRSIFANLIAKRSDILILKNFTSHDYTIALESLVHRLNPKHEKALKIQEDLNMQEAGEFGEKHLLTILTENKLPENTFIFHNVILKSIIDVQIDLLLLSPYWCLILEVKNLTGELTFTSKPPQLICEKENKKITYRSPASQLNQYIFGLKAFLENYQYQVPIYGAVVLPFNNAIIKNLPDDIPLLIGREIINYIWSLPKNKTINSKILGELLIKNCQRNSWSKFPLAQYYGINPSDIKQGVACPHCGTIPMKRLKRTWYCENCQKSDMYAHKRALKEYYMLINQHISPREAMEFLKLRNRYEARRILQANSIGIEGITSSLKYELSLEIN